MTAAPDLTSGKGAKDENFPVASFIIAPRHRPVVMAFYRVARMADDIADHPQASADEKLDRLAAIERSLTGAGIVVPVAVHLRESLTARGLGKQHMLDLLQAFRRDVTQTRYADWGDLIDYCRYSAAPVGRFMLDVHGESRATWPASDALCAALQVINHLQDCGKDYADLDRVYLPADALAAHGVKLSDLSAAAASPALRQCLIDLTGRTQQLLLASAPLAGETRDLRLAVNIGVIQRLAESLTRRLLLRDPLSQRVHHHPLEALGVALLGVGRTLASRQKPSAAA